MPAEIRTALSQYYSASQAAKGYARRKGKQSSRGLPLFIAEDGRALGNGIGIPNDATNITIPQSWSPPTSHDDDDEDTKPPSPLITWTIRQLYVTLSVIAKDKVLAGGGVFHGTNVPFFADEWERAACEGDDKDDIDLVQDTHLQREGELLKDCDFDDAIMEEAAGRGEAEVCEEEEALAQLCNVAQVKDTSSAYAQCTPQGFRFGNDLPLFLTPTLTSPTASPDDIRQTRLLYARALLALPPTTPTIPIYYYMCSYPSCESLPPFKDRTKLDRHIHLHHTNPAIKAQYKRRITGCPYCVLWVIQNSDGLDDLPEELLSGPEIISTIEASEWEKILEQEVWPCPVWKKKIFKSGNYRGLGGKRSVDVDSGDDESGGEDFQSGSKEEEEDGSDDDWIEKDIEYDTADVDGEDEDGRPRRVIRLLTSSRNGRTLAQGHLHQLGSHGKFHDHLWRHFLAQDRTCAFGCKLGDGCDSETFLLHLEEKHGLRLEFGINMQVTKLCCGTT